MTSEPTDVAHPSGSSDPTPSAEAASAPVYRSRREMRAAGGYLRPAEPQTPGGAPETIGTTTASIPVVLPAATHEAAAPREETPDAFAALFAATPIARGAAPSEDAIPAPDLSLPTVEAPTSRRALREARASIQHAPRMPRDRHDRVARPERAPRDVTVVQQRKRLRDRLTAAGVMVLVGGLFAALALPAYADSGSGGVALVSARTHGSQALGVDASLDKASTARDSYSATSAEDLRALYASALRQKNLSAYLASGSVAQGNDYPWPSALSRNQGGGLSPLGYYYRECVDFVAWRLNRDAGATANGPWIWTWSNLTPSGGNASQWKAAWLNHGWATGTTPQVGAVAWFPGQNHVAYVSGILASGQIVIDEYNWGGLHQYDQRVIDPSTVQFLYAPPR